MGTASTKKFLKQVGGNHVEEPALLTSAGAGDANRVPALNTSGVLDASFINSVVASAGAGDAAKHVRLDGSGRIDSSVLPVGVGADTATIQASEALAAGDWVNIHNSGGARVRKADASTDGKAADGFVLASAASGANAAVYFKGTNTQVSSQTPGPVFLSPTTAGLGTATAPTTSGQVVQRLGVAISATAVNFERGVPILLNDA